MCDTTNNKLSCFEGYQRPAKLGCFGALWAKRARNVRRLTRRCDLRAQRIAHWGAPVRAAVRTGWVDGLAECKGGRGSDTGHWLATWSAAP